MQTGAKHRPLLTSQTAPTGQTPQLPPQPSEPHWRSAQAAVQAGATLSKYAPSAAAAQSSSAAPGGMLRCSTARNLIARACSRTNASVSKFTFTGAELRALPDFAVE
jgi:hypothetical protein